MVRATLFLLALGVAAGALAQPDVAKAPKPPAKQVAKKAPGGPAWAQLDAQQQKVLEPLKPGWDNIAPDNKTKWLGIAKRYPKMKPEEQERVQRRMEKWANLSPEQRRLARDNFRTASKVSREKHKDLRQQWAEYQALSPNERQSLISEQQPAPTPKKKKK